MSGKLYAAYFKAQVPRTIAVARDERQVTRFFQVIYADTGLDRSVAEVILNTSGEIDHPDQKFLYATEEVLRALGTLE